MNLSELGWSIGAIAFFWGILSAVSLPLGAGAGVRLRPGKLPTSVLMAFGAGALLFALTIELFGHALHKSHEHGHGLVYATVVGAIAGGLLFDVLNQLLNNRGAFLRNISNTKIYVGRHRLLTARRMINRLSKIRLLRTLPPAEIALMLRHVRSVKVPEGEVIFEQGDLGESLYFINKGEVELTHRGENGFGNEQVGDEAAKQGEVSGTGAEKIAVKRVGEGGAFGVLSLLATHKRRAATAKALTPLKLYKLDRGEFKRLLASSPELQHAARSLVYERLDSFAREVPELDDIHWKEQTIKTLDKITMDISDTEVEDEAMEQAKRKGAALAIWLGLFIDAIPESLVIGMLANSPSGMSYAFIAGVFLANFPEAMSSSTVLIKVGFGRFKIFSMWIAITLVTGIGAWIGAGMFPAHPTGDMILWIAGIEGLAAGAMLTAIAESMLPEAFEHGGAITGFACLLGFLASLMVKLI
jgi:CRP-like cAMP-binding protein